MSFERAMKIALDEAKLGTPLHYTVDTMIDDYVADRRTEIGDTAADAAKAILENKHVLPKFKGAPSLNLPPTTSNAGATDS